MTKKLLLLVIMLLVSIPIIVSLSNHAFAQSVDTAWVRRYNGPGNWSDYAYALAVDRSGNIYVTGGSYGSGTSYDYATIKYYPNGDTAWVKRYNGPSNWYDYAYAIAVDDSGNVYVTGKIDTLVGKAYYSDYATIKYFSNGDTAWVRRYNGPGNAFDEAYAIAVNGFGNVYVTGYSIKDTSHPYNADYATIKYFLNGDTAWIRRYNGPGNSWDVATAIVLDDSNNVYVTGYSSGSGTNKDYATIKYSSNGDTIWVRRYNGAGDSTDVATAIAIDTSGNVYVTGYSFDSGPYEDFVTIKYYQNGDTAWIRRYNGERNGYDEASAIAIDGSGNVYVTGYSSGTGTVNDYATIKYYPNGDTAWVRRYDGPGNLDDEAYAIAVDDYDNVYVTGFSHGTGTYYDYATIKYDTLGNQLLVKRYNGPGNELDVATAMAIDDSGNIYVTGYSYSWMTGCDYATIKYVELQFLRGDCDKNGNIDLVDVILLANYILKGGPAPIPLQSGDVNCDGKYDLVDVIKLARYVLFGELLPC